MQVPPQHLLAASDGVQLAVTDWPAAASAPARGGIVLMHGIAEHSGRYANIARFFNEDGWQVRSYDHRGHGRSGGAWGDVPHSASMLDDAKIIIDDFAQGLGAAPLLFGHSMGGLFAACFASAGMSPLRGLILSSPALAVTLTRRQKLLLKTMRLLAPGRAVATGLKAGYLSHDAEVNAAYASDPLVHSVISARLLQSMLDAVAATHANAAALTLPTLMLVAGDDHIVDAAGSRAFFPKLAAGIGTWHEYPDFYHEVFNEVGAERVFDDLRHWLARLPQK